MKIFKTAGPLLGVAIAGSQLVACSSDGGSNSGSSEYATVNEKTSSTQAQAIAITPNNATAVASSALKSALLSDMSTGAMGRAVNLSQQQNTQLADLATGIVITMRPVNCLHHGSFTLQASLETTGDDIQIDTAENMHMAFSTQFDDCNQGPSILDGLINMEFTAVINELINTNNISLEGTVAIDQLTITQTGYSPFVVNGTADYWIYSPDEVTVVTELSATDMYFAADHSYQVIEFDSYKAVDLPTGDYTFDFYGRFVDYEVENSLIEYQTLEPVTGNGYEVPTDGVIAVYGDTSSLYIDVLDDQLVKLSMDYDNDDVIDETLTSTWHELALSYL